MHLVLSPANPADLDSAARLYGESTGDLVASLCQTAWPVPGNPANADVHRRRAAWSCRQQKDVLTHDPTARMMKVVDTDASTFDGEGDGEGTIVALGRWHRYPDGYQHVGDLETVGCRGRHDAGTWEETEGMDRGFYLEFLDSAFGERRVWMGEGHYWALTNIVTRAPYRGHGAASTVIEWGLREAAREGVPAFLAANLRAKKLYERHGFRQIGKQSIAVGHSGTVFEVARMRADPARP